MLQIVQSLDPRTGGVGRAAILLSEGLQRLGVEVELAAQDASTAKWLSQTSIKVHALGEGRTSYRYGKSLKRWLLENADRFDCAIGHGIWQYHSLALRQVFRRAGKPYFIFPHGMLDPWFKKTSPLKHLKKWMYWPWADYRVLRDAAAVIFTSEEERLLARKSFWLYRARERISPLGIDPPLQTEQEGARRLFAAKFPAIDGTRMVLFLGRIHPKKGCDLLLQAWPGDVAEFSLVMAGPDQVGWAKALRQKFNSRQIIFTGMLEGALKRGAFENADAFILPSHQENFGVSVVEALSHGVPVLLSDRVNIWREIESDHAGYMESDDLSGTVRLLKRWMHTSPGECVAMRANARRCYVDRFTLDRAAQLLLAILQSA